MAGSKKEYFKARDKLALELGLLILGFTDFTGRITAQGKKVSDYDNKDFKERCDNVMSRYADLVKRYSK